MYSYIHRLLPDLVMTLLCWNVAFVLLRPCCRFAAFFCWYGQETQHSQQSILVSSNHSCSLAAHRFICFILEFLSTFHYITKRSTKTLSVALSAFFSHYLKLPLAWKMDFQLVKALRPSKCGTVLPETVTLLLCPECICFAFHTCPRSEMYLFFIGHVQSTQTCFLIKSSSKPAITLKSWVTNMWLAPASGESTEEGSLGPTPQVWGYLLHTFNAVFWFTDTYLILWIWGRLTHITSFR